MSMSFKHIVVLLAFSMTSHMMFSQQKERTSSYYDVLGEMGVSFALPLAYGQNFLSEAYTTDIGFSLRGMVRVDKNWLLGANFGYFGAEVSKVEQVGNMDNTSILHLHALVAHSFLKVESNLGVRSGIGPGYAKYQHRLDRARFKDTAFSLLAFIEVSYRLGKTVGLLLNFEHYWDFLAIDSAPSQNNFFRRTQIFSPSIGLKFYIL